MPAQIATPFRFPALRLSWATLAILFITLLLHLLILQWVEDELKLALSIPSDAALLDLELEPTTSVRLLRTPASQRAQKKSPVKTDPTPAVPEPSATTSTPESTASTDPVSPTSATPAESSNETGSAAASVDSAQTPTETSKPEAGIETATANAVPQAQQQTAPVAASSIFTKVSLPPPAQLNYTVLAARDGRKVEGRGTINWQPSGEQYSISGDAGIIFLTVLNYKSTGSVDLSGITPELYVEKRFGKSETNTHFHRERKTISFSASTNSYPTSGGEQDRASVIWQIAAMGRGDSDKFTPGLNFGMLIAGTRSAAVWRVVINGKQSVRLTNETVEAWHLTILPVEQSQELQFELWLAPEKEWYPVKLVYSDKKSGFLELVLNKLEQKFTSTR
ncbi:MAG: DUF3108 domain-containing protein [Burkholderiales bacterium]|nr:DUF3108 domain-containing protein [Burkholderiales bacterium]